MKELFEDGGEVGREEIRVLMRALQDTCMPFGKFGPKDFPPRGVPLTDLPPEYLQWFCERGWPQGRLGELMQSVYEIKACGADFLFDPLRRARGGRTDVRKKIKKPEFRDPGELDLGG